MDKRKIDSGLVVKKEDGLFTLREVRNGVAKTLYLAPYAQGINDYIRANYPDGTIARWIIVPQKQATILPFSPANAGPLPLALAPSMPSLGV